MKLLNYSTIYDNGLLCSCGKKETKTHSQWEKMNEWNSTIDRLLYREWGITGVVCVISVNGEYRDDDRAVLFIRWRKD